jgi:hypothetical protein
VTHTVYAIRHLDGRVMPGEFTLEQANEFLALHSHEPGWYLANLREEQAEPRKQALDNKSIFG